MAKASTHTLKTHLFMNYPHFHNIVINQEEP
jgi:hypothetical protein